MAFVAPGAWHPVGIDDLEPAAWEALKHRGSTCVVAGPGAGKTEFLAQRAAYLLQTGICPPPFRILAISFKRDAAENLAARVRKRCTPEQAVRFISLTFDSFTKSLVDRFLPAIPGLWRPTRPYEIAFPGRRQVDDFLTLARLSADGPWQREIAGVSASDFEARYVGAWRLPLERAEPTSGIEYAVQRWWNKHLSEHHPSALSFVLINRLAEIIQRANVQIGRALRATYPFIFIDEFQDTTYAQYDLVLSAFGGSTNVLTAVGDDKQRIMGWAGARQDAFAKFAVDFSARRIPLRFNFRSSPDLVRIQQVVAQALDAGAIEVEARTERLIDGEVAQIWTFITERAEAAQVANWISNDILQRGTKPRDYAILVRQTADRFEAQLRPAFAIANVGLRNESRAIGKTTLQDLLVEELTLIGVAILRLATRRRAPDAWVTASNAMLQLRGIDPQDEAGGRRAEADLIQFLDMLRRDLARVEPTSENADAVADRLLTLLDMGALARSFVQYAIGDNLAIAAEGFRIHFAESSKRAADWNSALDIFEGVESTPLMTVHKSKGLEYDTILFVGLDDRMWWSHSRGNPEGIATFFVALSRAKQRAIFTFCSARGARDGVADLYELLSHAAVTEAAF